jgi:cysteine desulfurase / selenocysteine lyase
MNTRRNFLRILGLLGISKMLPTDAQAGFEADMQPRFATDTLPTAFGHAMPKSEQFDTDEHFWGFVRKSFQIPAEFAYLNTGTIGISPLQVISAIQKAMYENEIYGFYGGMEDARKRLAAFVNVPVETLSLTHNTSESINIVAHGLPLRKGDEVILTAQEHAGNGLPWIQQMRRRQVVLKIFEPKGTAAENLESIHALISRRTRVIAIPHISCTIGTVFPIKEIATLARSKGIWTMIDGAHATGMKVLDISDLGCDFYASCCHKWLLGAKGTGYLYVSPELLNVLEPVFTGADAALEWDLSPQKQVFAGFEPSARRYDYGTRNATLWRGVIAAIDFFESIGMEKVERYTQGLADYLYEKMAALPERFELLSPQEAISRSAIIGYRPKNIDYKLYAQQAARAMLRVRQVPESNLQSIRISTHIYNNKNEIDRLINFS